MQHMFIEAKYVQNREIDRYKELLYTIGIFHYGQYQSEFCHLQWAFLQCPSVCTWCRWYRPLVAPGGTGLVPPRSAYGAAHTGAGEVYFTLTL